MSVSISGNSFLRISCIATNNLWYAVVKKSAGFVVNFFPWTLNRGAMNTATDYWQNEINNWPYPKLSLQKWKSKRNSGFLRWGAQSLNFLRYIQRWYISHIFIENNSKKNKVFLRRLMACRQRKKSLLAKYTLVF